MARFSVSGSPSIINTGTLCLGLTRKYSGVCNWPERESTFSTVKSAPASVSVTNGTSAQVRGA